MFSNHRKDDDERGFTLIELMVVVLIIAILIAIAIPSFLGTKQRAADRAVQSNVRNAFTATRIWYADVQAYSDIPAEMAADEGAFAWTTAALDSSSPSNAVYVAVHDIPAANQTVIVGGRTAEGRCFFLKDTMGGVAEGTYFDTDVPAGTACPTPLPGDVIGSAWNGS